MPKVSVAAPPPKDGDSRLLYLGRRTWSTSKWREDEGVGVKKVVAHTVQYLRKKGKKISSPLRASAATCSARTRTYVYCTGLYVRAQGPHTQGRSRDMVFSLRPCTVQSPRPLGCTPPSLLTDVSPSAVYCKYTHCLIAWWSP